MLIYFIQDNLLQNASDSIRLGCAFSVSQSISPSVLQIPLNRSNNVLTDIAQFKPIGKDALNFVQEFLIKRNAGEKVFF